jgi:hypothetical protein
MLTAKAETESLQKRMKDADNVLSEKMSLTRQVIALQVIRLWSLYLTKVGTGKGETRDGSDNKERGRQGRLGKGSSEGDFGIKRPAR